MDRPQNVQDCKPEHFPEGVPALKWKRGLYYRPNNCGYTSDLLWAGLYSREDVMKYCFDSNGKNGSCEVYGMPLWMAIEQNYFSKKKISEIKKRVEILEQYIETEDYDTVIF